MADGTVTQSMETPTPEQVVVKFAWLAAATSGSLSSVTTDSTITKRIRGMYCVLGVTNPGDTTAPTDNYDITVDDSFGCDIFGGELENRASGGTEQAVPMVGAGYMGRPIPSALSVALTNNAVASASGSIYLVFVE